MKLISLSFVIALGALPLQAQESTEELLPCHHILDLVDEIMQIDPQPSQVRIACAFDETTKAVVVASVLDEETEAGKNYTIELHTLQ